MKVISLVVGLGLIVTSGIFHGVITDRWSDPGQISEAIDCINNIPLEVGDWTGEVISKKAERTSGSIIARYCSKRTGKCVTIYLGCGRPGPLSIHTPDACYAASGFTIEGQSTETIETPAAGGKYTFFSARIKKIKMNESSDMKIFWGWLANGEWTVSDNPRIAFRSQPVLFKLYIIHEPDDFNESSFREFCKDFIPVITQPLKQYSSN